ncbi:hypothetical protein CDL15_Pgr012335 [Punica granatum]|uniref:PTBP1-like RNA recognition motif 2 domain-containing protein n=1 Tax=Punica granatum TaxID=22663 RepID=A0A218Y3X6_PUNGR|nr:hypothetical protein CDL15_Pgr012335 [Punica granatum]
MPSSSACLDYNVLFRPWCNFLMLKLLLLQKMHWMGDASLAICSPRKWYYALSGSHSAHTDLSVKFQSHRSRAYTNPYLPVAQSAIDGSGQLAVGVNGKKLQPESNVLLALIENMQYAVMLDVLHMVFSAFGPVQKIAMFDKNGGVQALIQFCKLHLSYSRHTDLSIKVNNDWSRDYTLQNPAMANTQPSIFGQQPGPATSQYGGPGQYPPVPGQTMMQQPTAGWGPAPGSP